MMRHLLFVLCFWLGLSGPCRAQRVVMHEQKSFPKTIPAGGYSGITWMGGDLFAVVSDISEKDGFFVFQIDIDDRGDVVSASNLRFNGCSFEGRDNEGIAWFPSGGTLFISGEKDNQVREYTLEGQRTGRSLRLPPVFSKATRAYGLEALTYNAATHRFWTTTESTLDGDGPKADAVNGVRNLLRLQSFDDNLNPCGQYVYQMDEAQAEYQPEVYAFGVSSLAALDDGRLLVLEREFAVPESKLGAMVYCKIYLVQPGQEKPVGADEKVKGLKPVEKKLITEWTTAMGLLDITLANYEGMCVGPKLSDGGQVILLISDSQKQYGGVLKDWFRTLVLY